MVVSGMSLLTVAASTPNYTVEAHITTAIMFCPKQKLIRSFSSLKNPVNRAPPATRTVFWEEY